MATEISIDKAQVGASMRTLAAILAGVFAAGGGYTTLHNEITELKTTTKVLVIKEERRSERDSEAALHMQRIDDGLDHMRETIDRIDKNVQAIGRK